MLGELAAAVGEIAEERSRLRAENVALKTLNEAMPGFGILAAVLGIVMAMNTVAEGASTGEIAVMVAAAMVWTFIGIFFCYGVLDPLSNMMKQLVTEELAALESVKVVLVTHVAGKPPLLAIDAGRRLVQLNSKPSFVMLEGWIEQLNGKEAAPQPRRRATDRMPGEGDRRAA